jgi:3-deoxy-D-manno-octulosonate 8-phosphate phosphatase (KDO 8-P phosphatase)
MSPDNEANIELLVLDVDGVLTDGRIYLTAEGDELKAFHVRDGSGIKYWLRAGRRAAIITGRSSRVVARRAEELGIEHVRQNAKTKLPVLEELLEELGVDAARTAVMGDDLTDLPMMRRAGLAVTVPEAPDEVRAQADLVTRTPGGQGCVREVIERLLKRQGLWDGIMERYRPPSAGRRRT